MVIYYRVLLSCMMPSDLVRSTAHLASLRNKEHMISNALKQAEHHRLEDYILRDISDTLLDIHLDQIDVQAWRNTCMTRIPY